MSRIYFKQIGIILESILKLIEVYYEKTKNRIELNEKWSLELLQFTADSNLLMIKTFREYGIKIGIDVDKISEIYDSSRNHLNNFVKEYEKNKEFFIPEQELISKEIKDVLQDIKDFIKKIETEKME